MQKKNLVTMTRCTVLFCLLTLWSCGDSTDAPTAMADGSSDLVSSEAQGGEEVIEDKGTSSDLPAAIAYLAGDIARGFDVFLIDWQEGSPHQLTDMEQASGEDLVWSPDGSLLGYTAGGGVGGRIQLLNLETGVVHDLSPEQGPYNFLSWRQSGFVFNRRFNDINFEVFLVEDLITLQRITDDGALDLHPDIAANGTIVFASNRSGNFEIYAQAAGVGTSLNLTNSPESELRPVWSPDGERLAFARETGATTDVFVVAVDGTDLRNVTPGQESELLGLGAWSPDGEELVLVRVVDDVASLVVADLRTDNLVELTPDGIENPRAPSWSPDGSFILFVGAVDGSDQIFVVDRDGKDFRPLTQSDGDKRSPSWRPSGD